MDRILTQSEIRQKLRKQWDTDNSNYYDYHAVESDIGDELDKAVKRIKELEEQVKLFRKSVNHMGRKNK